MNQITILWPEFRCRYEGDYRNRCNREDCRADDETIHDRPPAKEANKNHAFAGLSKLRFAMLTVAGTVAFESTKQYL